MSWDALNGIRQGEQDAKASERAKRRGAKLAGGGGRSRSKTRFTRKEGRASLNRGGRGISINYQKSVKGGKGFKGAVDYALNPEKSPELIFSNCGTDPKSIIKTMEKVASLRPDITPEGRVGHITLSLPPRAGHGEKRWVEMIDAAREKLGIDDSFACAAVRHGDRDHDHVHLIFSRISIDGKVHDKANIGLRCVATEALIEKKFSLEMVPEEEFKSRGHLDKDQLEKGLRTKTLPPRLQISAALAIAVQDRPTVQQFAERLQASGIGVKANVATTGRMNGFSFTFSGVSFSGSKISKEYGWLQLQKVLDYEQNNDTTEYLAQLDGTTGRAGHDLATAVAFVAGLDSAVAAVSPATAEPTGLGSDDPAAPDRTIQSVEHPAPKRPVASNSTVAGQNRRPAPVPNRVPDRRLVEPIVAAVGSAASLITPPDLRTGTERWARSAKLLAEFRRGIKSKIDIAQLDRLASDAGHEPADIVSAHATALDKLPAEIVQDVLKAVQSQQMQEYVEHEFAAAKKRSAAQRMEEKVSDAEAPSFHPK